MQRENELSYIIRGVVFNLYYQYGPGLLESAYKALMTYELKKRELNVKTEVPLPLIHESIKLEVGYRIDLLVDDLVIIEIKSVENLLDVHHKQLITYVKLSQKKLGLLVNFKTDNIQKSIFRKVNNL